MKIQARKVSVKRHTVGYKVGGKWRSRLETVQLAEKGRIEGVAVYQGEYGKYIQSLPSTKPKLYELPVTIAS